MKIKLLTGLFIIIFFSFLSSCDKEANMPDEPQGGEQEEPGDKPEVEIIDLSAEEMANCYIIQQPGIYKFKADNMFNQGSGLPVPPKISPVYAELLWQTNNGSIKKVEFTNENEPYVIVEVAQAVGNALIAVFNEKKEIEWSWHIWMPLEDITSYKSSNGYEVMNMNLGALNNSPGNASSYGMLYQWGRKDPFPAASSLTGDTNTKGAPIFDINGNRVEIRNSDWADNTNNTISYSIKHPTVCLSNYSQYNMSRDWLKYEDSNDALWGNPNGEDRDELFELINKGEKTCYDPSPAGWRVPPCDVFKHFTSNGGYEWNMNNFNVADLNDDGIITLSDYNYGWHFMINKNESLYFPAAARYDGSYAMLMGSVSGLWGNYWSNTPSASMNGGALVSLAFQIKDMSGNEMVTISPSASSSRADAFSIRCIRDL